MSRYQALTMESLLVVEYDSAPQSPREWCNLGKMMCFHSRYSLGDYEENNYDSPDDLLIELVKECVTEKKIMDYIRKGNVDYLRIVYNRSEKHYELQEYWETSKKWFDFSDRCYLKDELDIMANDIVEALEIKHLMHLLEDNDNIVILPLYLYDHSGITMNTSGFYCRWDSGQVGWIYATKEDICKEFGIKRITKEIRQKVEDILRSEVAVYDDYIRGDVFGFKLYDLDKYELQRFLDDFEMSLDDLRNDDLECFASDVDSCWGFYGSDFKENGILEHVGIENAHLVEKLEYVN